MLFAQQEALDTCLPKMVKIYGSGGLAGFDDNQTGILISADGKILTVASGLLDEPPISCTLNNGQKYKAQLIGIEPRTELAVLKIDASTPEFFDISDSSDSSCAVNTGDSVLALSNLYGVATGNEPVSVQHGIVSTVVPLEARRGGFIAGYKGSVILIDAITNNPGVAGGALVNYKGDFLGLLGKQLKSTRQSVWINYALPRSMLANSVEKILHPDSVRANNQTESAQPTDFWTPARLGIVLSPCVLPVTPAYVDSIIPDSPANKAGIKSDDFIVTVNGVVVRDASQLKESLRNTDTADPVALLIQRGEQFVEVIIK